jgi:hypothetical protein
MKKIRPFSSPPFKRETPVSPSEKVEAGGGAAVATPTTASTFAAGEAGVLARGGWRKRSIFLVVLLLALVGAAAWGYMWWNAPATTSVTVAEQRTGVLGSQDKLLDWQTALFSTRYPASFRVLTSNETAHGSTIGQYLLSTVSPNNSDQLGVTVGKLGTMKLQELSSVKMRTLYSDEYTLTDRSFAPEGSVVFTKSNPYETGVFWSDGEMYVEAVVSGSAAHRADLESALESVVTNWQWRTK